MVWSFEGEYYFLNYFYHKYKAKSICGILLENPFKYSVFWYFRNMVAAFDFI